MMLTLAMVKLCLFVDLWSLGRSLARARSTASTYGGALMEGGPSFYVFRAIGFGQPAEY